MEIQRVEESEEHEGEIMKELQDIKQLLGPTNRGTLSSSARSMPASSEGRNEELGISATIQNLKLREIALANHNEKVELMHIQDNLANDYAILNRWFTELHNNHLNWNQRLDAGPVHPASLAGVKTGSVPPFVDLHRQLKDIQYIYTALL